MPFFRKVFPCPLAVSILPLTSKLAATVGHVDFEALLRRKMRSSGLVLPAPSVAPLFRFTLLRVIGSSAMTEVYLPSTAHDVHKFVS
jgi:hypothetical protein